MEGNSQQRDEGISKLIPVINMKNATKNKKKTSNHTNKNKAESRTVGNTEPLLPAADPSAGLSEAGIEAVLIIEPEHATPIAEAYEEVMLWRRNIFDLPKGGIGKEYVEEMTRLINRWSSTNEEESLKMLMSMPNLLLQRSSKGVKARVNKEHLRKKDGTMEAGKI